MKFADIDLKRLASRTSPDKTFLSLYLESAKSVKTLDRVLGRLSRMYKGKDIPDDEQVHFEKNVNAVKKYLEKNPFQSRSLCLFSSWISNYFEVIPLSVPVPDLAWVDSSPYIRPLAELKDEYENVAVVIVDNKKAKIYLVSSAIEGNETNITGNIKNHVKKGGWSQQRYERRRDKQLLLYAKEICDALDRLDREESFRRIVILGSREILQGLKDNMPNHLLEKLATQKMDIGKNSGELARELQEMFVIEERLSEQKLWQRIREEFLRGGLAVAGLHDVLIMAGHGRVETAIVTRDFKPCGTRCKDCDKLMADRQKTCTGCRSQALFEVDLVNEIVELLKLSGAEIDFADPMDSLTKAGDIAAFLRY